MSSATGIFYHLVAEHVVNQLDVTVDFRGYN
jgi:hypothetical protein